MDWWRIRHGLKTLPRSNSGQTDSSLLHNSVEVAVSLRSTCQLSAKGSTCSERFWPLPQEPASGTSRQFVEQQDEESPPPSEPSATGTDRTGSFIGSVTTLASHSYTTGYRTSYAGTEAGSVATSAASRPRNLARSMSRYMAPCLLPCISAIHLICDLGCLWNVWLWQSAALAPAAIL